MISKKAHVYEEVDFGCIGIGIDCQYRHIRYEIELKQQRIDRLPH